jgi:molybdopterin-containing oxidoreductase family iron-sulfur binding subunit
MDEGRRSCLKKICYTAAGLAGGVPLLGTVRAASKSAAAQVVSHGAAQAAAQTSQLAMVVDMAAMTDEIARDCIEICHREHNVPSSDNPEREIKWVWQEEFERAFPDQFHGRMAEAYEGRKVLLMCNHCTRPACVRVCPTAATWKRESDGIVMMDMHRCIGCRYCVVACPYGTRSFNWKDAEQSTETTYPARSRGVVEKCNFCSERLRVGEEPLCVTVSQGTLTFGDLADPDSEVSRLLREKHTITRKNALGTGPNVYYIVEDKLRERPSHGD